MLTLRLHNRGHPLCPDEGWIQSLGLVAWGPWRGSKQSTTVYYRADSSISWAFYNGQQFGRWIMMDLIHTLPQFVGHSLHGSGHSKNSMSLGRPGLLRWPAHSVSALNTCIMDHHGATTKALRNRDLKIRPLGRFPWSSQLVSRNTKAKGQCIHWSDHRHPAHVQRSNHRWPSQDGSHFPIVTLDRVRFPSDLAKVLFKKAESTGYYDISECLFDHIQIYSSSMLWKCRDTAETDWSLKKPLHWHGCNI